MSRFVYTDAAEMDFAELIDNSRREFGEVQARAITRRIMAAVERIAKAPLLGHVRSDLGGDHVRIWTVTPFLIVYQTGVVPIRVLRILHGARDVGALLETPVAELE